MTTDFAFAQQGGVGTLTLRPPAEGKPPTLDHESLDRLAGTLDVIERAAASGELRLLFVASASPRFFCVGANVAALATIDASTITAWIEHGHRVFARLEDLPVPTVARVEGYALGGGLELALACDLIFAADTAQLGQTEARLGFVAGWGGSWRLPRRVGTARAKELFFSARVLAAAEAKSLGLVDACLPAAELAAQCDRFAVDVLAGSAESHRQHKRLLARNLTRAEAASAEAASSVSCLKTPDTKSRLQAFLTRKK